MNPLVLTDLEGGVLKITVARPEKKNALTNAIYAAIADALEAARGRRDVRAVMLASLGENFCAGNDLGEFAAIVSGSAGPELQASRMLRALVRTEQPVVAAVQGAAVGIGTTLLLHCDLVVAAEDARFSAPFVKLALVPEAASSKLMPAMLGHARAFGFFALGETLSASQAAQSGLVNTVVACAELHPRAAELARQLAALPPLAMARTKLLMRDPEAVIAQMALEEELFIAQLQSPEGQAAFSAIAGRRNEPPTSP
jgi:enoyl-CoA hydratase/carnithine racemase